MMPDQKDTLSFQFNYNPIYPEYENQNILYIYPKPLRDMSGTVMLIAILGITTLSVGI